MVLSLRVGRVSCGDGPPPGPRRRGTVAHMLQDLAALTPPLIVCVAFLIGVGFLVRRELAPRRRAARNAASFPSGRADPVITGPVGAAAEDADLEGTDLDGAEGAERS